jgi:hypothetical protein
MLFVCCGIRRSAHHCDTYRAGDVKLVLLVLYIAVAAILPSLSAKQTLALHFLHTVFWRCFHSFGLGVLLREQSERKYIVRYFMSHYYYPEGYVRQGALEEAFTNWKSLYNMSVCMTYGMYRLRASRAPADVVSSILLFPHMADLCNAEQLD